MENEFKPLVLIPTYNEALNIKSFIEEVFKYCPDINLLIIDDNSPDGTAEIVHSMCDKRIYILKRAKKTGLASAYIEGFRHGINLQYNAFIEMDADFSHKPEYLPTMLENLKKYDFVIGSRNIKGGSVENWSIIRNLISKGYSFQIELKYRAYKKGFKYVEFPIVFPDRKLGESKMSKDIFFEAMKNVFKIRFSK